MVKENLDEVVTSWLDVTNDPEQCDAVDERPAKRRRLEKGVPWFVEYVIPLSSCFNHSYSRLAGIR